MRRFDESGVVRIVAERLAKLANRALQYGLADKHAGPQRRQQFLLGNQASRLAGQELEHGETLRSNGDALSTSIQLAPDGIEAEVSKGQGSVGRHRPVDLTESSPFPDHTPTICRALPSY